MTMMMAVFIGSLCTDRVMPEVSLYKQPTSPSTNRYINIEPFYDEIAFNNIIPHSVNVSVLIFGFKIHTSKSRHLSFKLKFLWRLTIFSIHFFFFVCLFIRLIVSMNSVNLGFYVVTLIQTHLELN